MNSGQYCGGSDDAARSNMEEDVLDIEGVIEGIADFE